MKITIEKVKNHWTVECGCKRIVFGSTESDLFITALLEYISDPEKTIEKYTKEWELERRLIDKVGPGQPQNLGFPRYYYEQGLPFRISSGTSYY